MSSKKKSNFAQFGKKTLLLNKKLYKNTKNKFKKKMNITIIIMKIFKIIKKQLKKQIPNLIQKKNLIKIIIGKKI